MRAIELSKLGGDPDDEAYALATRAHGRDPAARPLKGLLAKAEDDGEDGFRAVP